MVEIRDELMARHVIEQAREYGEWGDVYDTAAEGEYGQYEYETDWSLTDMNPSECDVDMDDETVVVSDMIEAEYSVRTARAKLNPPGSAHPAEYETRTTNLYVSIRMTLGELPVPIINVE